MPALDIDQTYQRSALDLQRSPPSITRAGNDIRAPFRESGNRVARLTGSAQKTGRILYLGSHTPWLNHILSSISDYRNVREGWDGQDAAVPVAGTLDTAEMLAVYLNNAQTKLAFAVDALGRPTFSSNADDYYIHLTIDAPERLTLFAEIDGVEYFYDNVEFTGRKAPDELSSIL